MIIKVALHPAENVLHTHFCVQLGRFQPCNKEPLQVGLIQEFHVIDRKFKAFQWNHKGFPCYRRKETGDAEFLVLLVCVSEFLGQWRQKTASQADQLLLTIKTAFDVKSGG